MKLAFVFVTCRGNSIFSCIESYVNNAKKYNHSFDVFLVEDTEEEKNKELENRIRELGFDFFYYTHKDIKNDLRDNAYIFPQHSGACRGYAFLKIYQQNYDYMFTVDDDVLALDNYDFIGLHLRALELKGDGKWYNPFDNLLLTEQNIYSRGFPYNSRKITPVVLNQGVQLVGLDVDSVTLKNLGAYNGVLTTEALSLWKQSNIIVPSGVYTTISYTSVCIKQIAIPAYYTQLMQEEIEGIRINRFDDIFSGLFLKKIADHLGFTVSHGLPISEHRKVARDIDVDVMSEKRGIELMDPLWQIVDEIKLSGSSFLSCYRELAEQLEKKAENIVYSDYVKKNSRAMKIWCNLLER